MNIYLPWKIMMIDHKDSLHRSTEKFISAVDDFLTNGIQALQHQLMREYIEN